MVNSLNLFKLIKSLSKSEKRYFKLSVSFHKGDKSYVKLFEAIDRQKIYDEAAIKKQFSKEVFIKRLPVTNSYLYHQILKALNSFYANKSIDTRIREMMGFAEVLFRKDLIEEALLMLKKIKDIAIRNEINLTVLEINKLLRIWWSDSENIFELEKEDIKHFEHIKRIDEFMRINSGLHNIHTKHSRTRQTEEDVQYTTFQNKPLMRNEDLAISAEEKYYYFTIHAQISFLKYDWINTRSFYEKAIELIELNTALFTELFWQKRYAKVLSSYISVCSKLHLTKEGEASIHKLFKISVVSKQNLTLGASNFLDMQFATGNFAQALIFLKDNERLLLIAEKHTPNIFLPLYYINLTSLYFALGNIKKSHYYIHKIAHELPVNEKEDIHCIARIINLVLLYELGDKDLLEHNIRSTYRFLYKRNRLYKFEEYILLFIRKELPKTRNEKDIKKAFEKIAENLRVLSKDSYEKKALDYFDFISWLESKIQNRPMIDVLREKISLIPNPSPREKGA